MPWDIYIIECNDGKLYTGITNNLKRRIKEHQRGNGCKFTKGRIPVKLRYSQRVDSRSEALKGEARIKALPRLKKIKLIK
jgi:putative endonuclease